MLKQDFSKASIDFLSESQVLILDAANVELVSQAVQAVAKKIHNEMDNLNYLDAAGGDGDTGTSFARAADVLAQDLIDGKISLDRPSSLFRRFGLIAESRMGGTCGASETKRKRSKMNFDDVFLF